MRVCSFGSAYFGFKEAHKLGDDVVGNLQDFKSWMLQNGIKIDEKDVLHNMYVVGEEIEKDEEKKMKKNKEDGYFTVPIKEGVEFTDQEIKDEILRFKNDYHKTQKQNRIQFLGLFILFILIGWGSKLYGNEYKGSITFDKFVETRKQFKETIIPETPLGCGNIEPVSVHFKEYLDLQNWFKREKKEILYDQQLERYVRRGVACSHLVTWGIDDYTIVKDGKRYLCVPVKIKTD